MDGSIFSLHPLSEAVYTTFLAMCSCYLLLRGLISFQPVLFSFCFIVKLRIVTLDQNFIASSETVSQEGTYLKSGNVMSMSSGSVLGPDRRCMHSWSQNCFWCLQTVLGTTCRTGIAHDVGLWAVPGNYLEKPDEW